jgi:hypothetical protein
MDEATINSISILDGSQLLGSLVLTNSTLTFTGDSISASTQLAKHLVGIMSGPKALLRYTLVNYILDFIKDGYVCSEYEFVVQAENSVEYTSILDLGNTIKIGCTCSLDNSAEDFLTLVSGMYELLKPTPSLYSPYRNVIL